MSKFYFTYGSEGHPFYGGWTEVHADDFNAACDMFRKVHPDRIPGLMNCCSAYSEEAFNKTCMGMSNSNLGFGVWEIIEKDKARQPWS